MSDYLERRIEDLWHTAEPLLPAAGWTVIGVYSVAFTAQVAIAYLAP